MKFLIFIALFVVLDLVHAELDDFVDERKHRTECGVEFNITNETESYDLRLAKIADADTNENQKCYINCILEKLGLIKDGILQEDANVELENAFGTEEGDGLKEVKESCSGISGADKCETAYKLNRCFIKNHKYAFIHVAIK